MLTSYQLTQSTAFFLIISSILSSICSVKVDDKMLLIQEEEKHLINQHNGGSMTSFSIQGNNKYDAEFKMGSLNNFYSFLLRGQYNDFVISNTNHPLFSVNKNRDVMIFPNEFSPKQGLTFTGDFKIRGINQWKLVYEEDFSKNISGWSNNTVSNCSGVYMLGGYCHFGGGQTQKTFVDLPAHSQVKVEATYHFIDAWDGESGYMTINNGKNGEMEYAWIEQYSAFLGSNGINVCGGRWPEGKFASPISVVVPHKNETITIGFGATIEQDPCDESFGVSGIRIYTR